MTTDLGTGGIDPGESDSPKNGTSIEPGTAGGFRRRSRPIFKLGAILLLIIILPSVAYFMGRRVQSPAQAAADAEPPPPSLVTAPVEFRVLRDTLVFRGDVVAPMSIEVTPEQMPGFDLTVVTDIRKQEGDQVFEGDVLAVVSGRPILILEGEVPLYRDLKPGANGPDVEQVQAALLRLGFETGEDPIGVYGPATQEAVRGLYAGAGFSPIDTSIDRADDIRAANARIDGSRSSLAAAKLALTLAKESKLELQRETDSQLSAAERSLALVQATAEQALAEAEAALVAAQEILDSLEKDPLATDQQLIEARFNVEVATSQVVQTSAEHNAAIGDAEDSVHLAQGAYDDAMRPPNTTAEEQAAQVHRADLADAQDACDLLLSTVGIVLSRTEVVFLGELPATVSGIGAEVGSTIGATGNSIGPKTETGPLMRLVTGTPIVSSAVNPSYGEVLSPGLPTTVFAEATGDEFAGSVTQVGDRLTQTEGDSKIQVTVRTSDMPLSLVGLNVRVTVAVASTKEKVLVVPVAAVSANAEYRISVTKVDSMGGLEQVEVKPGMSASGYVEVEPVDSARLSVGDRVLLGYMGDAVASWGS